MSENVGELKRRLEARIETCVERQKFWKDNKELCQVWEACELESQEMLKLLVEAQKTFPHLHCFKNQRWHPKARIVCSSCCFDKDCKWFLRWLGKEEDDEK